MITTKITRIVEDPPRNAVLYWEVEDLITGYIYLKAHTACVTHLGIVYVSVLKVCYSNHQAVVEFVEEVLQHYRDFADFIDIPSDLYYQIPELRQFGFKQMDLTGSHTARIPK